MGAKQTKNNSTINWNDFQTSDFDSPNLNKYNNNNNNNHFNKSTLELMDNMNSETHNTYSDNSSLLSKYYNLDFSDTSYNDSPFITPQLYKSMVDDYNMTGGKKSKKNKNNNNNNNDNNDINDNHDKKDELKDKFKKNNNKKDEFNKKLNKKKNKKHIDVSDKTTTLTSSSSSISDSDSDINSTTENSTDEIMHSSRITRHNKNKNNYSYMSSDSISVHTSDIKMVSN